MAPRTVTTQALQANTLKRGQKVRLVTDLPGLPLGAEGKVALANGFTWNRYWVRFADGRVAGHVNHGDLVRAKDFERYLVARDREAELAERAAADTSSAPASSAGEAASAEASDGAGRETVVNGVVVPAYLLQRSADARERLGA